jgi:hypothetical protein
MRIRIALVSLLLAFPVLADDSPLVLTFEGVGVIRFGMTLGEAEKRMEQKSKPGEGYPSDSCEYIAFDKYPNVQLMVIDGKIVRAEVTDAVENVLGLKVGQRLAEVRKRFPHVRVTPNTYDDDGHDLFFPSPKKKSGLVAYESKGQLISIRGGLLPAVDYVEGCL